MAQVVNQKEQNVWRLICQGTPGEENGEKLEGRKHFSVLKLLPAGNDLREECIGAPPKPKHIESILLTLVMMKECFI